MFARPSCVVSVSIASQFWIAYSSFLRAMSSDEYFGHSIEKKHVCATGKWPSGLRVSRVCMRITCSPQSWSSFGSRLRLQMNLRNWRRCSALKLSSTLQGREHKGVNRGVNSR